MTTEVTISSKKPNHNPFRVRVAYIDQAKFNEVMAREFPDANIRDFVINEGESMPQYTAYVHSSCVILIDEIRAETD